MEQQASGLLDIHPAVALLLLAIVPGFCEEMLFRGFAFSGLRPAVGKWPTILILAGIFALFHATPQRLVITGGLGVLLGYVCWQTRSIWPAILLHALHNGLLSGVELAVEKNPSFGEWLGWPTGGELIYLPWHLVLPGLLCLLLGILILLALKPPRTDPAGA
jgi:membrane protease YdiL (CAAX protease family)